jgi:hypothetical protein
MSNSIIPESPITEGRIAPPVLMTQQTERPTGFFQWWYTYTTPPDPPANASFVKREGARRLRLLSTVALFMFVSMVFCLPASFFLPNHIAIFTTSIMIIMSLLSLLLCRLGRPISAGLLLVLSFEIAIICVIVATQPLDEISLTIFDLLILPELLAASLLPARSTFIVAVCNTLFICLDLLFQTPTASLAAQLQVQFVVIVAKPVLLQMMVASISYLWVTSTTKAIQRADRAEMLAVLEHMMVERNQELEKGIDQILQTHVSVANGDLNARAPLTQENVLWKVARSLNTLLVRYQRAMLSERELRRTEQAVASAVSVIQLAEQQQQRPRLSLTYTRIDPLLVALYGKTLLPARMPYPSPFNMRQTPSGDSIIYNRGLENETSG